MYEDDFSTYLTSIRASRQTVLVGLRYLVSEQNGDLTSREMTVELEGVATEAEVAGALRSLEESEARMDELALLYLGEQWADPEKRDSIAGALTAANAKLPVVELAILALVAMYGLYLIHTGGATRRRRRTIRRPDGTFEEVEEAEYADPSSWISGLTAILGARPTKREPAEVADSGADPIETPPNDDDA